MFYFNPLALMSLYVKAQQKTESKEINFNKSLILLKMFVLQEK